MIFDNVNLIHKDGLIFAVRETVNHDLKNRLNKPLMDNIIHDYRCITPIIDDINGDHDIMIDINSIVTRHLLSLYNGIKRLLHRKNISYVTKAYITMFMNAIVGHTYITDSHNNELNNLINFRIIDLKD